jgi:hypothetical protein
MEDHAESKDYLPEIVSVSSDVVAALDEGRRTADIEELIDRLVALDLPEHYGRPVETNGG